MQFLSKYVSILDSLQRFSMYVALSLPLFVNAASEGDSVLQEQPEEQVYFNWAESDASFGEPAIGRSYASMGRAYYAIGGRSPEGALLSDVVILRPSASGSGYETEHASLSTAVAFAGATAYGDKIYLVGGVTAEGVSDQALELSWQDGKLVETQLPSLPEPVALAGVTIHRSSVHRFIYVVGGITSLEADAASDHIYELSITGLSNGGAEWVQQADMPFGGRVAPLVKETYNEVVVVGGYTLEADQTLTPQDQTWGYARIPRDGHVTSGWEQRENVYAPIAFPAASKSGQSHLVLIGGDLAGGNLESLMDGTKPLDLSSQVWAFHDPTDTWSRLGSSSQPTYSGALLPVTDLSFLWIDAVGEDRVGVPAVQMDFVQNTKNVSWIDWSVIGVYFIIVACIGTVFARKQTNADSFALGSRNVKWWASGISMMATGVSTISFMAVPALVACIGMASQGPIIFMLIGILISAFVTYPLLRRLNITSTFEYVENRYGLGLRLFGSFNSIIVQMLGRIGVVVMLPALAISTMTGIDPWISVLVMGILTTLYSTAGGFEAVIWTDVVQGLLMLAGFAAIGILAFMNIEGGMSAFIEFSSRMDRLNFFITTWDLRVPMLWFAVFGFILQFMAFASDQATAQRVLAIPMKDVRKLAFLAGGFSILIAYMSGAVGMGLFGFFKTNPEYLSPVMKNDQMVPLFIVSKIPVGLSGLLLATLFAASMSTISSSVNVCAVLFGEDFYKRFNKKASGKSEMRVMQLISMLSGLVGTGIALFLLTMDMPTLWESFMRIMAYVGGGYVGIYILGMFTRRTHELGAIIGVITSFGVAYFVNNAELGVHWSGLSVVVVSSCVVTGYVSSLVIPWKRKDLAGLTVWDQIKEEPK